MRQRLRRPLVVALVLALVATVGGTETLRLHEPEQTTTPTASDDGSFLDRLGHAARELVNGGPGRARPEKIIAGLMLDQKLKPGVVKKPAKRVKELTGRRSATTRVFKMSDGRLQAEVSAAPRFYQDAKGAWQPINTTVSASKAGGFAAANTSNTFTSRFGASTATLARFELDGQRVTLGLAGAARRVTPAVKGDTVTYAGIVDGVDLSYEVTATAMKERMVLRSAAAASAMTFTLDAGSLKVTQRGDGSIEFRSPRDSRVLLVMPAPFMFDSRAEVTSPYGYSYSTKVTQALRADGGRWAIDVAADRGWLADPKRVWPVTVDPTIKVQPTVEQAKDSMVTSDTPQQPFGSVWRLSVGTTTAGAARSLVKFDLSSIPANTTVDSASLQMYYDTTHTTDAYDVPIEVREITKDWAEGTVTWNDINTNMGAGAATVVMVDDTDTDKVAMKGAWPASTSTLTKDAIRQTYLVNKDNVSGDTFTWQPAIPEDGTYTAEAHYVPASDRTTKAEYTVTYDGGPTMTPVDQTKPTNADWASLGTYPFKAGTTGRVVLSDANTSSTKAAIADAVRFTKSGGLVRAKEANIWSAFPATNLVQKWLNDSTTNFGFMLKAVDEDRLGHGGPRYEAAEDAYNGETENAPKLVINYGNPGVVVEAPRTLYPTGAALRWSAYTGSDLAEYQVHRSTNPNFTPTAATLVAPVSKGATSFTDTTATPTPASSTDPYGQVYYYQVAVKTAGGTVVPSSAVVARLPKSGQVVQTLQASADATISSKLSTTNLNTLGGKPQLNVGNNSVDYTYSRGLLRFDTSSIPTNARVLSSSLNLWSTGTVFGTSQQSNYNVHALTKPFNPTTATWLKADATTSWTAGGDYNAAVMGSLGSFGVDDPPKWRRWTLDSTIQNWINGTAVNNGLLVKHADEGGRLNENTTFLSSEASTNALRPQLQVVYTQPDAVQTYYAPTTPSVMSSDGTYSIPVTLSNPTNATWLKSDWALSYSWVLPDGSPVPTAGTSLRTALPVDVVPIGSATGTSSVDVTAQVKAPATSTDGNRRNNYTLKWELSKTDGTKLTGITALAQDVAVEEPTSDQLGLERFYSYAGTETGAGGTLMNNLFAGNSVWSYNAFSNPSRGLSTFVRLTYNSLDTSDSVAGLGWSLQASGVTRLGAPLDFHPNPNPTKVTFTDGDGTSHWFTWDPATSQWTSPKGVHLYLEKVTSLDCKPNTQERRAWRLTRPDRTQFYYDCEGFLTSAVDNNGNEMVFTYEERRSNNKPTKFLRYVTDPAGRQTLTIDYYVKGQDYTYISDTDWLPKSGTNLTNPKIIDHVSQITDISGRKLTFAYTDKGLLGQMVDGVGSSGTMGAPKRFRFAYDATQGNKNVKLVKITDPRDNTTGLQYYSPPADNPKFNWATKVYTDRLNRATQFAYTDPDGPQGDTINTTVTDAETHATAYVLDGYGRPAQVTNAKSEVTKFGWDAEHNIERLEEPNGAVSTWKYDALTGYPLEIKDAEAVKNGTAATVLAYQRQLNGHVAEITAKTSPEGRKWTYGYTAAGDLQWMVDPKGNTTSDTEDYKTWYTYDDWGQLLKVRDARGNETSSNDYDANGGPRVVTDALGHANQLAYDERGQVTRVTDALQKVATQSYDTFGRLLDRTIPMSAGRSITTPAPSYDSNDNVTEADAPNGAVTTASYDAADQVAYTLAPVDVAGDPQRKTSYTYDKVGNLQTVTEPKGNLTTGIAGDFVTSYAYNAVYQLVNVVDAESHKVTYEYDSVGNLANVTDPRKNLTADTGDRNAVYTYNWNHWITRTRDGAGHETSAEYDRDGNVVARTDEDGVRTTTTLDPRELVSAVTVPHENANGVVTSNVTKYEYDEVGNQTKTISPRGAATAEANDFAQVTVYDAVNQVSEIQLPYDPADPQNSTAEKIFQTYDAVGRLTKVSAPPSAGQTVRNDTAYKYFDNGWLASSVDAWNIKTTFDYNNLGQQTERTTTSGGGATSHTVNWKYYPNGNLANVSDEGIPTGSHEMVVDNSDPGNAEGGSTWSTQTGGTGQLGADYRTHPAGGQDQFVWKPYIDASQAGTYEVFVQYPAVTGAATNATYYITTAGGASVTKTVDQTQHAGEWVSLGKYQLDATSGAWIQLNTQNTNGTVVADGLRLVRDTTGVPDTEQKNVDYLYDANENLVDVSDHSTNARFGHFLFEYNGLNQTTKVTEDGPNPHSSTYDYDPNGNLAKRTYDAEIVTFEYDARDLASKVTRSISANDPSPKSTLYSYTPRKQFKTITKGNGNKVDYGYYLDGRVRTQTEKNGVDALVADHLLLYNANGGRDTDTFKVMNADNNGAYLNRVHTYQYDPRDRLIGVSKHDPATGQETGDETYRLDANSNVVESRINGTSTTSTYDRNRLMTSTTDGAVSEFYYDPFGRLETVSGGGTEGGVQGQYRYDGFDRKTSYSSYTGTGYNKTVYFYDAFDRNTAKREYAGQSNERETVFNYLGLSSQVLSEGPYDSTRTAQKIERSYSYGAYGERLSQDRHNEDGSLDTTYYSYNPHGDVEAITTPAGGTRATYGYTAYGSDEEALFTGADRPDPANPDKVPYNQYRFNSKRWDSGTKTYDMGARDYSPQWSRFLTRDFHGAASADMGLDLGGGTANRYAFGGGNPINVTEVDGHYGAGDFWNDVVGVFKGVGKAGLESFAQATAFTVFAMMDPDEAAGVIEETASYAVHNPGEFAKTMWHGVWDPIQADWSAGRHGEAIGRGMFELGSIVLGAKGTVDAIKGIRYGLRGIPRGKGDPHANSANPPIVHEGGRTSGGRAVAGHGWYNSPDGFFTIPRGSGTYLYFYVRHGEKLKDGPANMVERGKRLKPVEKFGPGDRVPNYTIGPPIQPAGAEALEIMSRSITVDSPRLLSDLIADGTIRGVCHMAVCREVWF